MVLKGAATTHPLYARSVKESLDQGTGLLHELGMTAEAVQYVYSQREELACANAVSIRFLAVSVSRLCDVTNIGDRVSSSSYHFTWMIRIYIDAIHRRRR
jgi:hypothetical protein